MVPFRTRHHETDPSLADKTYAKMAKALCARLGRSTCFVGKDAFTQDLILKARSWASVAVEVQPYVPVVIQIHGKSQAGRTSMGPVVLAPEFALKPKTLDPKANRRAEKAAQTLSLKLMDVFDAVECSFEIGTERVVIHVHLETL